MRADRGSAISGVTAFPLGRHGKTERVSLPALAARVSGPPTIATLGGLLVLLAPAQASVLDKCARTSSRPILPDSPHSSTSVRRILARPIPRRNSGQSTLKQAHRKLRFTLIFFFVVVPRRVVNA